MEFLRGFLTAPWLAVAGLLLASIPIIIHILNRTRYDHMDWAAMEFLLRAEEKTRRRVRLENLLLLLLRFLLVFLLGLALAQPFVEKDNLAGLLGQERTHHVLVIDSSYSMQKETDTGETSFEQARQEAISLVENHFRQSRRDTVSILAASRNPRALIEAPTRNQDRALDVLAEMEPTEYSADMNATLQALDQLRTEAEEVQNRELFWLTDMQRHNWSPSESETVESIHERLQALNDDYNQVVLIDTGDERTGNIGVADVSTDRPFLTTGRPTRIRATVKNFAPTSQYTNLALLKNERVLEEIEVSLSPEERTTEQFEPITFDSEGPQALSVRADGDLLPVDDRRHLAVEVKESIDILLVDGDPGEGKPSNRESYFVQQALESGTGSTPYNVEQISGYLFQDQDLSDYDLVILTNMPSIRTGQRQELEQFLQQGGGALMFLGDQVSLEAYNRLLYDTENSFLPARLQEEIGTDESRAEPVKLTDLDLEHPALQFFQDHEELLRGLMTHTWIHSEVDDEDPAVRVLARFDTEKDSPAILERALDRGRLLLIPTSASMDWNLWGGIQGASFLPLMDQLAQHLLLSRRETRNLTVGETLRMPIKREDARKKFRVHDPLDRTTTLSPVPLEDGEFALVLDNLNRSGIYELYRETDENTGEFRFENAVSTNVEPAEGNLERLSREQLEELYPAFSFELFTRHDRVEAGNGVEPDRGELWFPIAVLLLVLLCVESLFSLRIDQKRSA